MLFPFLPLFIIELAYAVHFYLQLQLRSDYTSLSYELNGLETGIQSFLGILVFIVANMAISLMVIRWQPQKHRYTKRKIGIYILACVISIALPFVAMSVGEAIAKELRCTIFLSNVPFPC